jgi:flavin reductase (DIM6/NTAB) family NADH-FMN oxidoreductase RutF
MTATGPCDAAPELPHAHLSIEPSVLYFGNLVAIVCSSNANDTTNLAPISSVWALGHVIVLGLGIDGHTLANLRSRGGLVLNLPWSRQWEAVEALALLTGADPVPESKPTGCTFAPDKFAAAGWRPLPSQVVRPARIAECAAHIEAMVQSIQTRSADGFAIVTARAVRVHAAVDIVVPGTSHIDPMAWDPLVYNFRHYFGLGPRRGIARRAEYRG